MDDIVIFSDTWEEHLKRLEKVLFRLMEVHGVGTIKAKVKSIIDYTIPKNTKSLMRFLGMAGYYRKFCKIFQKSLLH